MDVKDGIGPLTDEDGNVISDNKDMAQVLNQYFTTVFTDENMDNIPESRCLCRDENILKDVDVRQGLTLAMCPLARTHFLGGRASSGHNN